MYQGHIEASSGPILWDRKVVSSSETLRGKRLFDLVAAAVGLSLMLVVAGLLIVLNPLMNPGPLFFRQERMGRDGVRFTMWKFRTMSICEHGSSTRPALAPLERSRITPFAQVLRNFRIDELPNFINVLRGEMSVIGPRPDAWEHARFFCATMPLYSARFRAQPGITGLAQVRGGYADCVDATRRKARFDYLYVRGGCWGMELFIIWQTVLVVLTRFGAK